MEEQIEDIRKKSLIADEKRFMARRQVDGLIETIIKTKPSDLFGIGGKEGLQIMSEPEQRQTWQDWTTKVKVLVYDKAFRMEGILMDDIIGSFQKHTKTTEEIKK